jgi:hypothetical protein
MRRTNRSIFSLGWPQFLLIIIISMAIFSFFLIQPFVSPSPISTLFPFNSPVAHSLPPTPPRARTSTNYSKSNHLIQQQLLSHLLASKDFVRSLRGSKVIMAWNETARRATRQLQDVTRCYLLSQYGQAPHHNLLAMTLKFPKIMIENDATLQTCVTTSDTRTLFIELAPMMMLPHAFYTVPLSLSLSYSP